MVGNEIRYPSKARCMPTKRLRQLVKDHDLEIRSIGEDTQEMSQSRSTIILRLQTKEIENELCFAYKSLNTNTF